MSFFKLNSTVVYVFFLLLFLACQPEKEPKTPVITDTSPPLFTLLSPQQTNIDFQNTLKEGLNTNILMYEYFYNGGGVAAGDVNGDGLIDLYFTSNMDDNKLYLNKGNFQFEDITLKSGVAGRIGPWKTGVTMVDINGDNRLDIYLCYSGALPPPKRSNQLFINEGNGTNNIPKFTEQAAVYGLASAAFSNQGYFFDYDRDGDLDMLLLNHNPKSLPILNEVSTAVLLKTDDPFKGIRVYRQTEGIFEDVTTQTGVIGSELSYGLGIGITDVNNDNWPDFYVSNDYAVPDYLYINNQDGTFSNQLNESVGHNSQFSMGNDIADINNDGLPDIVTLDMLPEDNRRQKLLLSPDNYAKFDLNVRTGFHYQYMRNMLQLNNGDGTFSEIGQLAGISNTDWSWAALLADYDNDGWKDLFVTNGYFRDYTNLDFIKYMDDYVQSKGRLQRENVLEIVNQMPSSNVVNYIFSNEDGLNFSNKTRAWGMNQAANSNGAAYADLDNDGDLDMVVNNINQAAFVYRNEAQKNTANNFLQIKLQGEGLNTQGIGAKVSLFVNGKKQVLEQVNSRGYLSAVSPILHFGLGNAVKIDSLIIKWPRGKQQMLTEIPINQQLVLAEKEALGKDQAGANIQPIFKAIPSPIPHQNPGLKLSDFDRQPLLISELSFSGPCMVKGDVNSDGLDDVFVGGAAGQAAAIYLQQRDQQFQQQSIPAFVSDQATQDVAAAIFDANGDGFVDIYVASGGYHSFQPNDPLLQDRLYLNDGQGNFSKVPDALPEMRVSKGGIAVNDVNQDGHPDLFVAGRVIPGRYPETPASFLLINDGKGHFTDQIKMIAPELQSRGMITDAVWHDLNQDGKQELIVAGEWLPIAVFGMENAQLKNQTLQYFDQEYKGWWNNIAIGDFNQDQKPDLIVGNLGTNAQFIVSNEEPAELYFKDFDNNGSIDPIFCFYIQGKSYPYVTRDELLQQLSGLRSRYTSYKSYADATINDIFKAKDLKNAGHLSANHLETMLFLSNTQGKFDRGTLPIQTQFAPIYTTTILDYDQDGKQDVLLCGNNSHSKLRLGKFDANYGTLLKGDGKGGFVYIRQPESGFQLKGDVRSVIELKGVLLFGINQGKIKAYDY